MNIIDQILQGGTEVPPLEEGLKRAGFFAVESSHSFPVTLIQTEDGRVFASVGFVKNVVLGLFLMMFGVKFKVCRQVVKLIKPASFLPLEQESGYFHSS